MARLPPREAAADKEALTHAEGLKQMDAETAPPPTSAARHLQLDSPMRPQVIKFSYRKMPTGHSSNGKDDSSQDPKTQSPSSPLSRQSLSTPSMSLGNAGDQCWMARYLCILLLILAVVPTVKSSTSTCSFSHLADDIIHNCNSTSRTIECCQPIVFAVDIGGGVDCLCLVSHISTVIERGLSFKGMLTLYIDCGGLHPEAFHHATNTGHCSGPAASPPPPPQQYSPPLPTSSGQSVKLPAGDYWNELAIWHDALGLPSPQTLFEAACAAFLVVLAGKFRAYLQLLIRRILWWISTICVWGAPERIINRVELSLFARSAEAMEEGE